MLECNLLIKKWVCVSQNVLMSRSWERFVTSPPVSETLLLCLWLLWGENHSYVSDSRLDLHPVVCCLAVLAGSRLIKGQTTSWLMWSWSVCVFTGLMLGNLLLFSLCARAAAMFDSRLDVHWDLWKKTHEKTYQNEVRDRKGWRYICKSFLFVGMKSVCKTSH